MVRCHYRKQNSQSCGHPDAEAPMLTSARNQFSGRIRHISRGLVNDEIDLVLAGGERVVTIITSNRSLSMRLEVGRDVIVLVRPTSVILTTDNISGFMLSARNLLSGTVKHLHTDLVNTEVVITLKGEDTLVAVITSDAAKELELTVGKTVNAIFKATDVILGVQR
jgi:molybdate transport system regulatory protein